jgi:hypothetical protein
VQSPCSAPEASIYADGNPSSRHNYSGLAYLPNSDELMLVGGLKWCAAGDAVYPADSWRFSFATNTWRRMANPPASAKLYGAGLKLVYEPASGVVYANRDDGENELWRYTPSTDTWAVVGGSNAYRSYAVTLDTKRRLMVYVGPVGAGVGSQIFTQSLATGAKSYLSLTGDTGALGNANGSLGGLAYDPIADRVIWWAGGQTLHSIDLEARTIKAYIATGAAPPATPSGSGTYGRFRYVPGVDVFALVTSPTTPTLVYRPAWRTVTQPPIPPVEQPPTTTPGDIVPGVFYALATPSWGGPSAGSKHVSFAFHPPTNRVVSQGGDFQDSRQQTADSYRQEMYAFDFAARWADRGNRDAGWTLLQPYCPSGTGIQPKSPDFVGWVWDAARGGFWYIPGTAVIPVYAVCSGRTVTTASDPQFIWRRVMFYNGTWTDKAAPGPTVSDNWQSFLDPQRDLIVRFGYDGGSGGVADILDLKTLTWRRKNLETAATGGVRMNTAALAVDPVGRRVYAVDPFSGKFFRYNMDTETVDNLGVYPGGPYTLSVDKWSYSVWDSVNRVVINWRNELATKLYVFDPAAGTWSTPAWTTDPVGGAPTVTHAIVYDPTNRVTLFLGSVIEGAKRIWAYRYK